jgi:hypothetical protein
MNMGHRCIDTGRGNLSQHHFVHQKSHELAWDRTLVTNHMSHGTAVCVSWNSSSSGGAVCVNRVNVSDNMAVPRPTMIVRRTDGEPTGHSSIPGSGVIILCPVHTACGANSHAWTFFLQLETAGWNEMTTEFRLAPRFWERGD